MYLRTYYLPPPTFLTLTLTVGIMYLPKIKGESPIIEPLSMKSILSNSIKSLSNLKPTPLA